ncbi:MAG: hypothetical protein K9G41_02055 [Flavobacteriales bacterium]|nr:hypothetical protein [Flavobacteriales bacterium]
MKKLFVVLALSIGGTAVFAQDAATEFSNVENQQVTTKGGKLMHKLQVAEAQSDSKVFVSDKQKLEQKKVTVANDALMKSTAEPKALRQSEEK